MQKKFHKKRFLSRKKRFFLSSLWKFSQMPTGELVLGISRARYERPNLRKKIGHMRAGRFTDRSRVLKIFSFFWKFSLWIFSQVKIFTFFWKKVCEFSHNYGKSKNFLKKFDFFLDFLVNVCYNENGLVRPGAARQLYHTCNPLSRRCVSQD